VRYAIVTDIHGNIEALDVALSQLGADDAVWCLGDIVGYGPNPNECVNRVRERAAVTILGNHDLAAIDNFGIEWFNPAAQEAIRWTQGVLSKENAQWLNTLNYEHREANHLLVHGAPQPDYFDYILDKDSARKAFAATDATLIFIGHTHIAELYALAPEARVAEGERMAADVGDGLRAVGAVGGVADIDDVLVGQLVDDRPRDGQPPDAGVEDPDGRQRRAHVLGRRAPAFFDVRALRSGADNI